VVAQAADNPKGVWVMVDLDNRPAGGKLDGRDLSCDACGQPSVRAYVLPPEIAPNQGESWLVTYCRAHAPTDGGPEDLEACDVLAPTPGGA
jgi:hypothetical protein